MPETATGIVYPDSSGHTRLWEHFQALAESVDPLVAAIPRIATGIVDIPLSQSGNTQGSVNVDFPAGLFTVAPVVTFGLMVTPRASAMTTIRTGGSGPTATGMVVAINVQTAGAAGDLYRVMWTAIQTG